MTAATRIQEARDASASLHRRSGYREVIIAAVVALVASYGFLVAVVAGVIR